MFHCVLKMRWKIRVTYLFENVNKLLYFLHVLCINDMVNMLVRWYDFLNKDSLINFAHPLVQSDKSVLCRNKIDSSGNGKIEHNSLDFSFPNYI